MRLSIILAHTVSFYYRIIHYNKTMSDIRKTIGNIIKNNRKRLKLTQAELAIQVEVEPKYISRIETGTSYPSLAVLERIFTILNIDIADITKQDNSYIDKNVLISMIISNLKHTSLKNLQLIKEIVEKITQKE